MVLNSGTVQCLKTCTVDSSMKIPANTCQVYNIAQLWMTFARDWLCSGFTLVCKGIYYSNKSHGEHDVSWKQGSIYSLVLECVVNIAVMAFLPEMLPDHAQGNSCRMW